MIKQAEEGAAKTDNKVQRARYVVRDIFDNQPRFRAFDTFDAAWSERGDGDVMQVNASSTRDACAKSRWDWGWSRDAKFCTRDGVALSRRVLLPGVASFDELFEAWEPWDYTTMAHYQGNLSAEGRRVREEYGSLRHGVQVGPFASVDMSQIGRGQYPLAVRVRKSVLDHLDLSTMDNKWSWELIGHKDSGRVLVVGNNGFISGRWIAYIDADTVPQPPRGEDA